MTTTTEQRPIIRYRRVDDFNRSISPYADYWIEVDGERRGYVIADRAGRGGGTSSHWTAWMASPGGGRPQKIAHAWRFKDIKPYVQTHFIALAAVERRLASTAP